MAINWLATGTLLKIFFIDLFYFYWKDRLTEKRRTERLLTSAASLPKMTTVAGAGPTQSQEPGESFLFHTWVQKPKHLGHSPLLSQSIRRVLDWKWSSQNTNQCPYRMLVLASK